MHGGRLDVQSRTAEESADGSRGYLVRSSLHQLMLLT